MLWFYPVSASYFFFALTSVINRLLLTGPLPNPGAYTFTIAAAGASAVLLIPFGFVVPAFSTIVLAFLAGIIGICAFFAYYHAIRIAAVSRVAPTVGALQPILTLGFSAVLAPNSFSLPAKTVLAILLLIAGTTLLSMRSQGGNTMRMLASSLFTPALFPFRRNAKTDTTFARKEILYALLAAACFSLSMVLTKIVYVHIGFLNGLIWTNLGSFIVAPVLLASPSIRAVVFSPHIWRRRRVLVPLFLEKSLGGLGSLLQQYSIFLVQYSQLALVHALQGLQYVFLLLFVSLLSLRKPELLHEELTRRTIPYRIAGTLAIAAGLYVAVA